MAAPAGVSDTAVVTGAMGSSVTIYFNNSTDGKAALLSSEDGPIATVSLENPADIVIHNDKFKGRLAVSVKGHALTITISQLRTEDAGNYSVKINGKTDTFTLQVFKELEVPKVTCEAQNCSGGICSSSLRCSVPEPSTDFGNVSYTWWVGDHTWDGSSVVLNGTAQEEPEPLTCTARNPVSSRNVTVTTPGALCAGADSGNSVWIPLTAVIGIGVLFIVLIFLAFRYKSKVSCVKERLRGRDGRQGDSHGAAGDTDTEAEVFV